jgi:hypothetical protein
MTEGASKLLRELALLLRRHPPEDFEELAGLLAKPDFALALSKLLGELATKAKSVKSKRRKPGRADILDRVRAEDESKYALLQKAQEQFLDKTSYKNISDLVHAIEISGIPLPRTSFRRREDLVLSFLRCASAMSTHELVRALDKLGQPNSRSDLRSWSDIIVPKKDESGAE